MNANSAQIAAGSLALIILGVTAWILFPQPKKGDIGRPDGESNLNTMDELVAQPDLPFSKAHPISTGNQPATHRTPEAGLPIRGEQSVGAALPSTKEDAIPQHLQQFLRGGSIRSIPTFEELAALTPEDQPILLEAYKQRPLSEKLALTWALATIGDETVVGVFTNAVLNEYSGQQVTQPDVPPHADGDFVLKETVRALATLAYYHDSAFKFIEAGLDPAFWDGQRLWQTPPGTPLSKFLSSLCIAGLGVSGRPEAWWMIEEFKAGVDDAHVDPLDLEAAAFHYEMVATQGADYLKSFWPHHISYEGLELLTEWQATEKGRAWSDWVRVNKAERFEKERKRIEELKRTGKLQIHR